MHDVAQQIFLIVVVALYATFMLTLLLASLPHTAPSEELTKPPESEVTPARRADEVNS